MNLKASSFETPPTLISALDKRGDECSNKRHSYTASESNEGVGHSLMNEGVPNGLRVSCGAS